MTVVPLIVFGLVLFFWTRALMQETTVAVPTKNTTPSPEEALVKAMLEFFKQPQEK